MIDFALLIILAVVAWCVASEGAWGAGLMLLTVIFAGLLAMNFFEPLANFFDGSFNLGPDWGYRWDFIALVGLFALFVFLIRLAHENLLPTFMVVQSIPFEIIRWTCGLATGYVVMSFCLTAMHTAPLPREFLGFKPERKNFFNAAAPDRQWLGFTQYVSEKVLNNGNIFDGPQFPVPAYPYPDNLLSHAGAEKLPVWPSFPIRYAGRRDELAAGGAPPAAAPTAAPASGGPAVKRNF